MFSSRVCARGPLTHSSVTRAASLLPIPFSPEG
nr:MAG TPA: hypothetical protein [Caudoviricetes sp.]